MELDIQCGAEKHKKHNSLIALITFQKDLEGGGQQREIVDKISRGQVFKIKLSNSKSCETGSLINSLVEKQNAGSLQIYTRKIN